MQTDEAINKYMAAVPEDDLDVIAVTECINQVTKSKNKLTTKSLLQFFTGYSCRFTAGAIGVIAEGTPEALKPVIWCLREHRDNQNVCQALAYVFELTYTLGKELVINSANFMRKIPSQVVYPIAKSIQRMFFSRDKFTKLMISEYLFICKTLPGMEKYVYKEFGDWIVRRYDESIADTVKKNDGFLRGQKSENVFPLTMILNGLDGEYHDSIRQLDENCKGRLAKAFSIARDNVDDETKENYLPNFYTGLKECLEERPDDLGKWAASICSEFRKQGEQGLLRGVVG